jgi:hypothetical protein
LGAADRERRRALQQLEAAGVSLLSDSRWCGLWGKEGVSMHLGYEHPEHPATSLVAPFVLLLILVIVTVVGLMLALAYPKFDEGCSPQAGALYRDHECAAGTALVRLPSAAFPA